MRPENQTDNTELLHPLDPSRIGPEGLTARLFGTLTAAVQAPEFQLAFQNLHLALRDDRQGFSKAS